MIGGQKDAISFAEEADMPIGVPGRPDHAVALTHQVDILTILNHGYSLVRWHSNDVMHGLWINLCKP